jgi:taurine dioxygenase
MKVTPLDAPLGARITGLDFREIPNAALAAEIRVIIHEHQVAIFPGQVFNAKQQLAFTQALGPVRKRTLPNDYVVPASSSDIPGIAYVSNIRDTNGEPTGVIPDGEMWFHHDTCYTDEPDKFTMLCALAIPKIGGNTMWCDMYQAWETMPEALKQTIRDKKALSVYDYATIEKPDLDNLNNIEKAWQPCVAIHPQTGREALFVNRLMTCQIEGLSIEASSAILDPVFDHAEQRQFVYEHQWTIGDFVIWDNLAVTHARTHFELGDDRRLRRSKVSGDCLVA